MKNWILIALGVLPYGLLLAGLPASAPWAVALDFGWLFVVFGVIGLATRPRKLKRITRDRLLTDGEAAKYQKIREQVREELRGERLLHSLN